MFSKFQKLNENHRKAFWSKKLCHQRRYCGGGRGLSSWSFFWTFQERLFESLGWKFVLKEHIFCGRFPFRQKTNMDTVSFLWSSKSLSVALLVLSRGLRIVFKNPWFIAYIHTINKILAILLRISKHLFFRLYFYSIVRIFGTEFLYVQICWSDWSNLTTVFTH